MSTCLLGLRNEKEKNEREGICQKYGIKKKKNNQHQVLFSNMSGKQAIPDANPWSVPDSSFQALSSFFFFFKQYWYNMK